MASVFPLHIGQPDAFSGQWGARLVVALVAGLLLAASYALEPLSWAAWLVPAPLLVAAARDRRWRWITSIIASTAVMANLASYYIELNGVSGTAIILLLRIASLTLALRTAEAAARGLPLALAMLVLPMTFAALEQVTMIVSPHGAAGSLAYSQMTMPGLVQVAALGGVPAVVFLILLPGSLAGLWMTRDRTSAQRLAAIAVMAALMLAVGLFSIGRMRTTANTVATTLIATNQFSGIPRAWEPVWRVYGPAVRSAATRGGLVVLPEKIALLDRKATEAAAQQVSAAARATGATIVLGLEVRDDSFHNRALVSAPDGSLSWYDKQRVVPGFEARDVPGTTPLRTTVAATALGIAICKDMHIPSIGREYAGNVRAMAVPAWDFGRDGWMGARMTAMRAVENGYAIARSSRDGLLGVYDDSGRVRGERLTLGGVTIVRAQMPVGRGQTLYGRVGDVFGWTCVIGVLFTLVATARDGRGRFGLRFPGSRRAVAGDGEPSVEAQTL